MSVKNKLKSESQPIQSKGMAMELTPQQRSQLAAQEIAEVAKKYHCTIEIGHDIKLIPLALTDKAPVNVKPQTKS